MSPALQPSRFFPTSFRKRLIVGGAIVLGILLALPFILPLGRFIPEIERIATEQIRDPVRISSLRAHALPLPHLTITGIEVGEKPYLQVRKVIVTPRLLSLLDKQKVIREVSLRDVVVHQPLLAKASSLASRPASSEPSPVRVERIEIHDADLNLKNFRLQQVDIDLALNAAGSLESARLQADGGNVQADLLPQGRDFSIDLRVRNWQLPAGPALTLSVLDAKGTIGAQGLSLPEITGRFYEGALAGKLAIGWKEGFSIVGNLDLKQVDIQALVAVFSRETTLSGRLSAAPVIDMRAASASGLAQAMSIESPFRIENGVIYDFDLAAAPKALIDKDALKGGQTKFDQFSGYLIVDATGYHLIDMKIASGVLKAEGEVSISPDLKLNGLIDASVKGTSALVSTPLAVAGTVQEPFIYPSKAAIAGAAAGTALLGPGLGTSVGMKAMTLTGKLFGKKKRAPRGAAVPAAIDGKAPAPKAAEDQVLEKPAAPARVEVGGRR